MINLKGGFINEGLLKIWNNCRSGLSYYDNDGVEADLKAYEFGEVDKDFVGFIRNKVQDYDNSKQSNFYIVEE